MDRTTYAGTAEAARQLTKHWWLFLLTGIASMLGVLATSSEPSTASGASDTTEPAVSAATVVDAVQAPLAYL